jgi:hypothetical protein
MPTEYNPDLDFFSNPSCDLLGTTGVSVGNSSSSSHSSKPGSNRSGGVGGVGTLVGFGGFGVMSSEAATGTEFGLGRDGDKSNEVRASWYDKDGRVGDRLYPKLRNWDGWRILLRWLGDHLDKGIEAGLSLACSSTSSS